MGRHAQRSVRPERPRDRLGRQHDLEPEVRQGHAPPGRGVRRGRRELHERRTGRRRHPDQLPQPADTGAWRTAARARPAAVRRPDVERAADEPRRLLARAHLDEQRQEAKRLQARSVRARQRPLLPGGERDGRQRVPVGAPRQQLGRVPGGRLPHPVLVQVQLLVQGRRSAMKALAPRGLARVAVVAIAIGADATVMKFNSIVAVEQAYKLAGGPEMNPLVNPGAIAATSMVQGPTSDAIWTKIIGTYNDFAGRSLNVLQDVYKSESDSNQRNQAIGMLMHAYGYIKQNPGQATDLYTRQCSVGVTAKDLATMAATLAFGGRNPITGKQAIGTANVPYVLAVMATAGLYDDSGKWLYHTGLPAKSGVGGGIIAVAPGKFGIAVVSPPLDEAGNSVRAQKAITHIVNALNLNPYASKPSRSLASASQ